MPRPTARLIGCLAVAAFVGGCTGGGCVGAMLTPMDQGRPVYARLPHSVPPVAGSAPFRFAMVHDVIHERYPRHGPAFYEERERLARERLAVLPADSETAFTLTDDIAVGLDRRGRTEEAIALMRDKLRRQVGLDLPNKELYSSYANLGEFLVRGNVHQMLTRDETARRRVEEGRDYLRRSLTASPDAHFGREKWQLVALDRLLDMGANTALMRQCDLIGNRLDLPIEISNARKKYDLTEDNRAIFGRPYLYCWTEGLYFKEDIPPADDSGLDDRARLRFRKCIFPVGCEAAPDKPGALTCGCRAPFDEPSLWIVGEWRQGSGPDPHLALCLGEIMLRVGQRYLAWDCYERARRMADRFWPTQDGQGFLRNHCMVRQRTIEASISAEDRAGLRAKFDAEFAFGDGYQRDYQTYEEQKIRAGADLNDENFYDEFLAGRPPIATRPGSEEWYAGAPEYFIFTNGLAAFASWGPLVGGAILLLAALAMRRRFRPRLSFTEIRPPSPAA